MMTASIKAKLNEKVGQMNMEKYKVETISIETIQRNHTAQLLYCNTVKNQPSF